MEKAVRRIGVFTSGGDAIICKFNKIFKIK